jgi:hypothetical protein
MSVKGPNTNKKVFPFDKGELPLSEVVSLRRWKISYRRARAALDNLERAGYNSAPFLKEVLNAFNDLIISRNESECKSTELLIYTATKALGRAHRSPRVKRLLRTRNTSHSDPACLILKRVVREFERIAGDLKQFDFNDTASRERLKEEMVSVLPSILTAEKQALQPAS